MLRSMATRSISTGRGSSGVTAKLMTRGPSAVPTVMWSSVSSPWIRWSGPRLSMSSSESACSRSRCSMEPRAPGARLIAQSMRSRHLRMRRRVGSPSLRTRPNSVPRSTCRPPTTVPSVDACRLNEPTDPESTCSAVSTAARHARREAGSACDRSANGAAIVVRSVSSNQRVCDHPTAGCTDADSPAVSARGYRTAGGFTAPISRRIVRAKTPAGPSISTRDSLPRPSVRRKRCSLARSSREASGSGADPRACSGSASGSSSPARNVWSCSSAVACPSTMASASASTKTGSAAPS